MHARGAAVTGNLSPVLPPESSASAAPSSSLPVLRTAARDRSHRGERLVAGRARSGWIEGGKERRAGARRDRLGRSRCDCDRRRVPGREGAPIGSGPSDRDRHRRDGRPRRWARSGEENACGFERLGSPSRGRRVDRFAVCVVRPRERARDHLVEAERGRAPRLASASADTGDRGQRGGLFEGRK